MVGANIDGVNKGVIPVSIPERGLGWLEPAMDNDGGALILVFQSLRGVWGGWSGGLLKALGYVIFQVQTRGSC